MPFFDLFREVLYRFTDDLKIRITASFLRRSATNYSNEIPAVSSPILALASRISSG